MVCNVDGCDRVVKYKGLCSMHYHRQYKHGVFDKPKTRRERLIENGKSYCPKCDEEKEISEFNRDKHTAFGIAIYCRECSKTKSNGRYKNFKREHRNVSLKSRYGISVDEYDKLLIEQKNRCWICGKETNKGRLMCVDHDHVTGKVRGLLCTKCNLGLGKFNDDVRLLERAIKYLKKL